MKAFLKDVWYWTCRGPFSLLPDKAFIRLASWVTYKRLNFRWYRFNLTNPCTFNEKLNYLKLKQPHPLSYMVADKVAVRHYVAKKAGKELLIPVVGVYEKVEDIPFNTLPDQFVLKVNHGSGWNIICTNKSVLDIEDASKKLSKWLHRNAWYLSREKQYKEIPPKIICESLIGENIHDYKFFCSHGNPFAIQVDIDRFGDHQRVIYDITWQKMDIGINYPQPESDIPAPDKLYDMVQIVKKLSQDFGFCRVDLYEVNNRVYFGEITLYPGGGFEPFHTYEQDLQFGQYVQVDDLDKPL